MESILSQIVFIPLAAVIVLGLFQAPLAFVRAGAMVSSLAVLGLALKVAYGFDPQGGMQYLHNADWITSYGISYHIGVDAISLVIVLVIALLFPLLYWYMRQEERYGFWYNMMLLQTGVTGAVVSLDLILFYLFWETMLLPVFIMIGRFGRCSTRYQDAMKIVLMTMLGSLSMLLSILYIGYEFYAAKGFWSFALFDLSTLSFDPLTSIWLTAGFLLAFVIKIPLVGFHTWMAPAYSAAPTPTVVVLSAVMAKLGVYGLWRFGYGMFEVSLEYYAPIIGTLAIIGLLYYAVHAIMERDLQRMFAFSSGSHLSLIALGLILSNIYAWSGSLYLIATHALASAGIFLMIGLLRERAKSVDIGDLGGIASVAPKFAFFFVLFALSIAGLPGTGGFVAELLIIVGAFKKSLLLGIFTATTMLAAMTFIFWMLQRTLFGSLKTATSEFNDLSFSEMAILAPLALLILATGIFPSWFMQWFEPQLQPFLQDVLTAAGGVG